MHCHGLVFVTIQFLGLPLAVYSCSAWQIHYPLAGLLDTTPEKADIISFEILPTIQGQEVGIEFFAQLVPSQLKGVTVAEMKSFLASNGVDVSNFDQVMHMNGIDTMTPRDLTDYGCPDMGGSIQMDDLFPAFIGQAFQTLLGYTWEDAAGIMREALPTMEGYIGAWAMLHALPQERLTMVTVDQLEEWLLGQGINTENFVSVMEKYGIDTKARIDLSSFRQYLNPGGNEEVYNYGGQEGQSGFSNDYGMGNGVRFEEYPEFAQSNGYDADQRKGYAEYSNQDGHGGEADTGEFGNPAYVADEYLTNADWGGGGADGGKYSLFPKRAEVLAGGNSGDASGTPGGRSPPAFFRRANIALAMVCSIILVAAT